MIYFSLFIFIVISVTSNNGELYSTKYDNTNVEDILNNKRLLRSYIFCLLERRPCSPEGTELKKILPDAIETECAKCTEKQKSGSRTVLRHMIDNEPEFWSELEKKFDPTGEYKKKYKEKAAKEGFKI